MKLNQPAQPKTTTVRVLYHWWILIWWLLLGIINSIWLLRDTRPPTWDPFSHLLSSLKYYHVLQDIIHGTYGLKSGITALLYVDDFYPPLAPFLTSFFYFIMLAEPDSSTLILNFIFTGVLLYAMYRLGSILYSAEVGFYASFAITSFWYFSQQSRMFMLDLPLIAMTTFGMYALVKTDTFLHSKASLLFGLISGLAMLTKWYYLFFIVFPLLYVLWSILKKQDRGKRILNCILCFTVWLIVTLPWYSIHFSNLLINFTKYGYTIGAREGDPNVFSIKSIIFYVTSLPSLTLIPWFILFIIGLIYYFRKEVKKNPILALWFIGGYVVFTLMRNKEVRFIMPLLPAVALFATGWLKEFNSMQKIKKYGIVVLSLYSLGNAFYTDQPLIQNWPLKEAFDVLTTQKFYHAVPQVRVIADSPYFERNAFKYYSESEHYPLTVITWSQFPSFTDFIITKTGDQGVHDEARMTMKLIRRQSKNFNAIFKKIWQQSLPDGTMGTIYIRDIIPIDKPPGKVTRQFKNILSKNGLHYLHSPEKARIKIRRFSPTDTVKGRFKKVIIRMNSALLGPLTNKDTFLPVHTIKIELIDLTIDPYKLFKKGTIEIISLREMKPQFQIKEKDVNDFLSRMKSTITTSVKFQNNKAQVHACWRKSKICADADIKIVLRNQEYFAFEIQAFTVAGIPLPSFLAEMLVNSKKLLDRQTPFQLDVRAVHFDNGMLTVEAIQ